MILKPYLLIIITTIIIIKRYGVTIKDKNIIPSEQHVNCVQASGITDGYYWLQRRRLV